MIPIFQHFKIIFIGSAIFSELELLSVYSRILRLVTMLEKKEFKNWATSLSSKMILLFYINLLSVLSKRKGCTVFQKNLLSLTNGIWLPCAYFCVHESYGSKVTWHNKKFTETTIIKFKARVSDFHQSFL